MLATIRQVIDRVLWTAGASEQNKQLLAEAINAEMTNTTADARRYRKLKTLLLTTGKFSITCPMEGGLDAALDDLPVMLTSDFKLKYERTKGETK